MASQKRQVSEPPKSGGSSLFGLLFLAVGIVSVIAAAVYYQRSAPRPQVAETLPVAAPAPATPAAEAAAPGSPASAAAGMPAPTPWPADLPPLPIGQFNIPRPPSVVRAVYLFAAQHPEILKYVPCYCGCNLMGHTDNEDCFVAHRDAEGHVAEWETHALT